MTAPVAAPAIMPAYTDEQLRAAWRRYKLATWPATFEATMADPVYSRLVRMHAAHIAYAAKTAPQAPASTPTSAPAAPAPRPRFTAPPGYVDHKRAAAGDRDDD